MPTRKSLNATTNVKYSITQCPTGHKRLYPEILSELIVKTSHKYDPKQNKYTQA